LLQTNKQTTNKEANNFAPFVFFALRINQVISKSNLPSYPFEFAKAKKEEEDEEEEAEGGPTKPCCCTYTTTLSGENSNICRFIHTHYTISPAKLVK
jgi:uncharacterized Zn-finger protein